MKKSVTKACLIVLGALATSLPTAQAQAVFRADVYLQLGVFTTHAAVGYFRLGLDAGEFEIAVFLTRGVTPSIYTPSEALTFSLGRGQERALRGCYPFDFSTFLPPPPPPPYQCPGFIRCRFFTGSFQSSPDLLIELLAGRGEFRLVTDSGMVLSGTMVVALPASIEQLVPCNGPVSGGVWKNHGEYVSTVASLAEKFLAAGLITKDQKHAVIAEAVQSNCGRDRGEERSHHR